MAHRYMKSCALWRLEAVPCDWHWHITETLHAGGGYQLKWKVPSAARPTDVHEDVGTDSLVCYARGGGTSSLATAPALCRTQPSTKRSKISMNGARTAAPILLASVATVGSSSSGFKPSTVAGTSGTRTRRVSGCTLNGVLTQKLRDGAAGMATRGYVYVNTTAGMNDCSAARVLGGSLAACSSASPMALRNCCHRVAASGARSHASCTCMEEGAGRGCIPGGAQQLSAPPPTNIPTRWCAGPAPREGRPGCASSASALPADAALSRV